VLGFDPCRSQQINGVVSTHSAPAAARVKLGYSEVDATLQGGLAVGAMHEVFAEGRCFVPFSHPPDTHGFVAHNVVIVVRTIQFNSAAKSNLLGDKNAGYLSVNNILKVKSMCDENVIGEMLCSW
jgi:hypothetical protein